MPNNKKGFVLREAVMLALVGVVLLFTAMIAYKIWSAFTSPTDDGSMTNFDKDLVPKIQSFVKNNNKLDYTQINYFLGNSGVLGYSKSWDSDKNTQVARKPDACSDKACLCFFKPEEISNGKPSKPCVIFDKVLVFLKDTYSGVAYLNPTQARYSEVTLSTNYYEQLPEQFNPPYKYLILDGSKLTKKSEPLYIEKYLNSNGEVVIYIAPINDATKDKISQRKAYIDSVKNK